MEPVSSVSMVRLVVDRRPLVADRAAVAPSPVPSLATASIRLVLV